VKRIFSYRLLCVARGEDGELPGFDENRYAAHGQFERRLLEDLLAEYAAARVATLLTGLHVLGGVTKIFMFERFAQQVASTNALPRGLWTAIGALPAFVAYGRFALKPL
jgi:hypothetical protein